jgi:hypothetical protein
MFIREWRGRARWNSMDAIREFTGSVAEHAVIEKRHCAGATLTRAQCLGQYY